MADDIVTASYPGLANIVSGSVAYPIGRSPGRITLTAMGLSQSPDGVGDLTFASSEHDTITLADCLMVSKRQTIFGGDPATQVTLHDRRWRWRFGGITGHYNISQGRQAPTNTKTPRELAVLLADAMGEASPNVSAMPNVGAPEVQWYASNPADQLDELCRKYGLVMGLDGLGRLKLFDAGQGSGLPILSNGFSQTSSSNTKALPDKVVIACGPSRYDGAFTLEAVGYETDGTIEPINDLSYKPAGGWLLSSEAGFVDVADDDLREKAKRDIFRLYRVSGVVNGGGASGLNPIGYDGPDVTSISQLAIQADTNEPVDDAASEDYKPAYLVGKHDPRLADEGNPTSVNSEIDTSVSVDTRSRLVRVGNPILYTDGNDLGLATIYLVAATEVTQPDGMPYRLDREQTIVDPAAAPPSRYEARTEIQLRTKVTLGAALGALTVTANGDNLTDVQGEADYYLDAMVAEHTSRSAGTLAACGIQDVEHSGDIHDIAWSWGDSPPTTRVGYNDRVLPNTRSYDEMQRDSRQKAEVDRVKAVAIAVKKVRNLIGVP